MDENILIPLEEEEEEDDEADNGNSAYDTLNIEEELERFRDRWKQELVKERASVEHERDIKSSGESRSSSVQKQQLSDADLQPSIEEQSKYLFMQGANAEQIGKLNEAIQYYRRAVQLVPDIEFRIEEFKPKPTRERYESTSSIETSCSDITEDEEDLSDLVAHFNRALSGQHGFCSPSEDIKQVKTHISCLPAEVLMYIFKWVISSELDVLSLEQLSMVSRGFYVCARDEELWRLICHRIWGLKCGSPGDYECYRTMYIERPHLHFNGCYISKASYYRPGEKSLDRFYRPYHLIDYYRYVRFFPEGHMLMLTTPDEPQQVVSRLRNRSCYIQGILFGYYRLTDEKLTAVLKRRKISEPTSGYKYRRQLRNQNNNDNLPEQSFHVEMDVRPRGKTKAAILDWASYSIHSLYRNTGQEEVADFELTRKNYPPLVFSRVKSYNRLAKQPLN